MPQRIAADVGHDIEEEPLRSRSLRSGQALAFLGMLQEHVTRIVERQNVGMGQSRHDLDLAGEPRSTEQHAQLRPQHLDRHLARRCFRSSAR